MTSLADRLREIVRPAPFVSRPPVESAHDVAEVLGGQLEESHGQPYVIIEQAFGPGYRHGRVPIMDAMPPWPRLGLLGGGDASRLLFIDVETTGLAGGAGTYAFLVGCGWFDGPTFRVRQFFLASYGAETSILDRICDLAQGASGVVTFNGKSFDLPLLETRFLFHRLRTPFAGVPHIDMLHPARRLWRRPHDEEAISAGGCSLCVLEHTVCGVARDGDVPGFEIPGRYFTYVRTGDARPLAAVLEHNRWDLVSLALLTARASQLLGQGPDAAQTACESLGLGRLYETGGLFDLARASYARSAGIEGRSDLGGDIVTRAEALRSYAVLSRRMRKFSDAAVAWQRLVHLRNCPARIMREAIEAMAIHHEHRLRDPHAARSFALQSLHLETTRSRQGAVHHRLARLERKLAGPTIQSLQF